MSDLGCCRLDEDDRLRIRDLEALAAANILAGKHIVNSNHVISRLTETSSILLVSSGGKLVFFDSSQPTHLIIGTLAAMGAAKLHPLCFRLLVKEIAFL